MRKYAFSPGTVKQFFVIIMLLQNAEFVGVVVYPGQITPTQTRLGQKVLHTFIVTDGKDSCSVKVWEEHHPASNALFNENLDTPVVVIIASVKI